MTKPETSAPVVYIVDDDPSIRHAMELLLRSVGLANRIFPSGEQFLAAIAPDSAGCVVLDIRMPGLGGLELQEKLAELDCRLPIIFVTGYGDVAMAVEAMQKGAFDFIEKPYRDQELLDRINDALQIDSLHRARNDETRQIRERMERLTNREREVMDLVVTGRSNKVIAQDLDVSQRTVEIHRARVMEKLEARSLADLVRMFLTVSDRP